MHPVTRRSPTIALAIALAIVTVACVGGGGADDTHRRVTAVNATTAGLLPTDAAALPQFDLATFQRLLSELRGTPVVVNVWGSWCGPCKQEAPELAAAHRRFGREVQFVGVDVLDARGSARAYQERYGLTFPSVFDPPGAIRDGLGLLGQPTTLFYDASGKLVERWSGPISTAALDRYIGEISPRS